MSSSGMAAQFTAMNGLSERPEKMWIFLATSSFPVPFSPIMSTPAFEEATFLMSAFRFSMMPEFPIIKYFFAPASFNFLFSSASRELKEAGAKKYLIIGNSGIMENLKADIRKVASSNAGVLIIGENGTGKELVARNIHIFSFRSDMPFIAVNCAAIPEELIESELFGHERGAFTGAVSAKKGRFDMADTGTLFLDEIGDMSLKTQAKILRILEEKSFKRVGGTRRQSVDVRVVAATNKNLEEEIKKGNFREDLYYRLNVIPFRVPALRERKGALPAFVRHFLNEFSLETGRGAHTIGGEALALFTSYDWPGNVRELRNLIERLVIMTPSGQLNTND